MLKEKFLGLTKKTMSLILAMIVSLSVIPFTAVEVEAASADEIAFATEIAKLKKKYPTGSYWCTKNGKTTINDECVATAGNQDCGGVYKYCGKFVGTAQCLGFANLMAYLTLGSWATRQETATTINSKWSTVYTYKKTNKQFTGDYCAGDYVRINSTWKKGPLSKNGGHSIFIWKVENNKIYYVDCNSDYKCKIRWDKTYTISELQKKTVVLLRKKGSTLKGTANSIYGIKSVEAKSVTNSSVTIESVLKVNSLVSKWSCYVSTEKDAIDKIDGTLSSPSFDKSKVDWTSLKVFSNGKYQTKETLIIDKYQGKPLEANATYYYKIAVKIGSSWYSVSTRKFKTAAVKPEAPVLRIAKADETIGIGTQATLLWDDVKDGEKYYIGVKNSEGTLIQSHKNIAGTTCVLKEFTEAGVYTATISAVNGAGSTEGSSVQINVLDDLTVTYFDTLSNTVIETQEVHYKGESTAPKSPVHQGHTFSKWDKELDNITEDTIISTVYDKNSYTVKFIDSFTNKILKTQTVKYGESAIEPEVSAPEGYALSGWSESFDDVGADINAYTVYKWADEDHCATISIDSVKRNTTEQGYDVKVTLSNKVEDILSGRIVVVLKSNNGVVLTSTESAAFAVDAMDAKTVSMTVLYDELAPQIEVYAINGYETLGQLSNVACMDIDNSTPTEWSPWITYEGDVPMSENETTKVETQQISSTTETKTYYRYKIKETTTSKATSLAGYTQDGYTAVKNSTGTVSYVPAWPSGFSTSSAIYKKYNVKPKTATETATQIVKINSNVVDKYIYWHWCRDGSYGAINRWVEWAKTSKYDTFHAFESKTDVGYNTSADAYKNKNTNVCNDSYWWNGYSSGSAGLARVKKQTYTIYDKVYNYYKVSDYSEWIEYTEDVPVSNGESAGTNKVYQDVETKTEGGEVVYTNQYRYMTSANPVVSEPKFESDRVININGTVDATFEGENVSVWVYKYAQASDYTNEYIGVTTVGEDGSITLSDVVLRETPTIESGDYTIVAAVQGQTRAIKIGTIEAPKSVYTVNFLDFDGNIISEQQITQGDNALLPDKELLNIPEGQIFTSWSESTVNVRNDMVIRPESETESYVVAFVDWENQSVSLKEFVYGSELVAETVPEGKEGYITEWVVQIGGEHLTIDEFTEAGKTITENTVVVTRSTPEQHTVIIVGADENQLLDTDTVDDMDSIEIADSYTVTNGDNIDFSNVQTTIEENPDFIFTGWINAQTKEPIEDTKVYESLIIYPAYTFAEDTQIPYSDVENGEFTENQTITLTSDTENATIWYTIDGADPKTSSTVAEYTQPIVLSKSAVLRYYATSVGRNDSEENSNVYAINTNENPTYRVVTLTTIFEDDTQSQRPVSVGLVKDGTYLPDSLFNSFDYYDFEGVYYDETCEDKFYLEVEVIDSTIELYVEYIPKQFTVSFIDYDGAEISSQQVSCFNSATPPENPTRDGYVFIGWDGNYEDVTEDREIKASYVSDADYATVALNRARKITLPVGTSFSNLVAVITPDIHSDYEVVWSSGDEAIATVDENGIIIAQSAGTTTITATLPYTNANASIQVTVVHNPDVEIVIKENSAIGFDSWGYIRGTALASNTVSHISTCFENEELTFVDANNVNLDENKLIGTGSIVILNDGGTVLDTAIFALTGDVNGDGVCDVLDGMVAQNAINSRIELDEPYAIALDSNGDGILNITDYQTLINQALS